MWAASHLDGTSALLATSSSNIRFQFSSSNPWWSRSRVSRNQWLGQLFSIHNGLSQPVSGRLKKERKTSISCPNRPRKAGRGIKLYFSFCSLGLFITVKLILWKRCQISWCCLTSVERSICYINHSYIYLGHDKWLCAVNKRMACTEVSVSWTHGWCFPPICASVSSSVKK